MNTEFSVRGRQYIILYNAIGMGGGLCHTFLKWLDQEDLEVFLWAKEKKDLMVLTAIMVTTTIRKNIIKRRTSELNI